MTSNLVFLETLPLNKQRTKKSVFPDSTATLLIYDRKLESVSREFAAWAKSYPLRYGVNSGESLKDFDKFQLHFAKLSTLASALSPREMTVIAAGGGSVGDFAGFFASIYKRGVKLIHMPSTWLAAIDSSHGGKTALNFRGIKNQLGTFYVAEKVILVRSLLLMQPEERVTDAMGELGKIALIDGGPWVNRMSRSRLAGSDLLWRFLKPAIESKLRIVEKDPKEIKGIRQILNLGHTVGHVFESFYGWPHGSSITQGLFFALEFSARLGYLKQNDQKKALTLLEKTLLLKARTPTKKIPESLFVNILSQDKKRLSTDEITFIFLRKIGGPFRSRVKIQTITTEARRQGWIK